jgi:hypothetical protein
MDVAASVVTIPIWLRAWRNPQMMTICSPQRQKLYAPVLITVLNKYVERVHLQNLLLGELKGDVAKIWGCFQR